MKKLQLDVETLRVESFATQPPVRGTGTVRGHETAAWYCQTQEFGCYSGTCPPATADCSYGCDDTTWGNTGGDCSADCSRNTCAGCTNEN